MKNNDENEIMKKREGYIIYNILYARVLRYKYF